ncbi:MAG TPA: peroxiredoxin-like family protein [Thermoleophilaceae bacterium]|nr:peroxiredoxin-like family protein [Thermoleophilaceae bacterium]
MTLQAGDRFPDVSLESLEGPVRLSERWTRQPLVIAFMRHFGCAFCREHLIQLGRGYEELRAAGGEVVAIFQYRAEPTVSFCHSRGVPFECLGDPSRAGYRAVGLERGERREYIGLNVYRNWFRAAKVGAYVGKPVGDVAQRPGTFVVDTGGTVVFAHYNRSSPDNPALPALLEAIKRPTLRPRA